MKTRGLVATLLVLMAGCTGREESLQDDDAGERSPSPEASVPTPSVGADSGAGGATAAGPLPAGVTQEMVQAGSTMFGTSICASCHGPQGTGVQGIGPNLTDQTWLNGDRSFESIVEIINTGVPQPKEAPTPMPPKGGNTALTDQQVQQLAAYIYSRSHGGA